MAQDIQLKDRVRFFPGLKKKDLPPMFDATFIATVPIAIPFGLAKDFTQWQDDGYGNYKGIVGELEYGPVSNFDYKIWFAGSTNVSLTTFNGDYSLYYNDNTNPETGSHSGFIYYTIYDFNSPTLDNPAVSAMLDIWESKVNINDATDYDQIK